MKLAYRVYEVTRWWRPDATKVFSVAPWLMVLLAVLLTGCAVTDRFGEFSEFKRYTDETGFIRLPVIFIPGMKGSRLFLVDEADGDKEVKELWGTSGSVALREGFDDLLLDFRAKMGPAGKPGESYPDPEKYRPYHSERQKRLGVRAGPLDTYRFGFGELFFAEFDIYGTLRRFLTNEKEGGYVEDPKRRELDCRDCRDLFFFSYDWRLDNRVAAVRLALELPRYRKEYMELQAARFYKTKGLDPRDAKNRKSFDEYWTTVVHHERNKGLFNAAGDIKFMVVGHSMGGLVARYFVWGMGRQDDVHRLLLMATPNLGAVDTLKAFGEGEFPEALTTYVAKWLPFSVFRQTDTKPILFSFASVFSLLPRHPRAAENFKLADLGLALDQSLAVFEARRPEQYFNHYWNLGLVPTLRSMRRYLGDAGEEAILSQMRDHLYGQLRSSFCFHHAIGFKVIRGGPGAKKVFDECEERARIELAEKFVKHAEPRLAGTSLAQGPRGKEVTPPPSPPVILFGGHCHRTYYRARLTGGRLEYVIAPEGQPQDSDGYGGYEYGDGRVPIWSTGWERPLDGIVPGYTFFLCEDHVGLVKNPAFRYNLLRELQVVRGLAAFY